MNRLITQAEIDRFFTQDAALLDEWRLQEWLAIVDEGCRYLVPALDQPEADHGSSLFLVSDDYVMLKSRVNQLLGRASWAENPRSRTRRLVTNARILEQTNGEARVTANFAIWRFQMDTTDVFVGRYVHRLVRRGEGLRLAERRCILDMEALRPHGKLSFIL